MKDNNKLKELYPFKCELHAHTFPVSACSEVYPKGLVQLYTMIGCHTVVVTNHLRSNRIGREEEYLEDYYQAKEIGEEMGLTVCFGAELTFDGAIDDYLVYGVSPSDIKHLAEFTKYDIATFYREFKNKNNIILQAHPFRSGMTLAPKDSIDGIEVFNMHPHHNSRVSLAANYARENNMIISGGTDFHHVHHEGQCLVRTKNKIESSFDVADVLKSGDFVLDINGFIVVP